MKTRKGTKERILLQASAGIYGIKTKMRVALITKSESKNDIKLVNLEGKTKSSL